MSDDARINELKRDLLNESTDVWVEAAIQLAGVPEVAGELIVAYLDGDDPEPHRRALTMAGALLSAGQKLPGCRWGVVHEKKSKVGKVPRDGLSKFTEWLLVQCSSPALAGSERTLGELREQPLLKSWIDGRLQRAKDEFDLLRRKLPDDSAETTVSEDLEKAQAKVALLSNPATPASSVAWPKVSPKTYKPELIAALMAGLSPSYIETIVLDIELLLDGLLVIAKEPKHRAWITLLPFVLARADEQVAARLDFRGVVGELKEAGLRSDHLDDPRSWTNLMVALRTMNTALALDFDLVRVAGLDEWLPASLVGRLRTWWSTEAAGDAVGVVEAIIVYIEAMRGLSAAPVDIWVEAAVHLATQPDVALPVIAEYLGGDDPHRHERALVMVGSLLCQSLDLSECRQGVAHDEPEQNESDSPDNLSGFLERVSGEYSKLGLGRDAARLDTSDARSVSAFIAGLSPRYIERLGLGIEQLVDDLLTLAEKRNDCAWIARLPLLLARGPTDAASQSDLRRMADKLWNVGLDPANLIDPRPYTELLLSLRRMYKKLGLEIELAHIAGLAEWLPTALLRSLEAWWAEETSGDAAQVVDSMASFVEGLRQALKDESADAFVGAALQLAAMPSVAHPLVVEFLDGDNTHWHRHALTLAAALTERGHDVPDCRWGVVYEDPEQWKNTRRTGFSAFLMDWLRDLEAVGFPDSQQPLAELRQTARWAAKIEERKLRAHKSFMAIQARILKDTGKGPSSEALTQACRERDLLSNPATRAADVAWKRSAPAELKIWHASSLIGGLSVGYLERIDVDVQLLVAGLIYLARDKTNLAWVANVHRLLLRERGGSASVPALRDIVGRLAGALEPRFLAEPYHYAELLLALRQLNARLDPPLDLVGASGLDTWLAPDLTEAFRSWCAEGANPDTAVRLMRLAAGRFTPRAQWREADEEPKIALALFYAVLRRPTIDGKDHKPLELHHRLRVVRQAMLEWHESNADITRSAMRLWKILLYDELNLAARNKAGSKLAATCMRQLYWVLPLLRRWNLRGLILKDLATIVYRLLYVTRELPVPEARALRARLLWTLFQACPPQRLLEEMREYAQVPALERLLDAFIERYPAFEGSNGRGSTSALDEQRGFSSTLRLVFEHGDEPVEQRDKEGEGRFVFRPVPRAEDLDAAVEVLTLSRRPDHILSGERWRRALAWWIEIDTWPLLVEEHETEDVSSGRALLAFGDAIRDMAGGGAGGSSHPEADFIQELRHELDLRVESTVQAFVQELNELELLNKVGDGVEDPDEAIERLWAALGHVPTLLGLVRRHLPLFERHLISQALQCRRDALMDRLERLQRRRALLSAITDDQDEGLAMNQLRLEDPDWGASTKECQASPEIEEAGFLDEAEVALVKGRIRDWMLDRLMIRELTEKRTLARALTSPKHVMAFIAAPFLLFWATWFGGMHFDRAEFAQTVLGHAFLVVPLIGVVSLVVFLWRSESRIERARLLVPHMVGALFLGIMQTLGSDEAWALTVQGNPVTRLAMTFLFLFASFVFTRLSLLDGQVPLPRWSSTQHRWVRAREVLRRRTVGFLAQGHWIAFVLIATYSALMGKVMEARIATGTDPTSVEATFAGQLDAIIPSIVGVETVLGSFFVFPAATLAWTAQLFFFSAVIKRVLN